MFAFDKKDFQRFAVSTIGAITLSAACVVAAVGPVRAGVPTPFTVSDWQSNVEKQIDARMRGTTAVLPNWAANDAVVSVRFTADGDYAGATLAQSSGVGLYDDHALNIARHVAYPALPAGVRGTAQTVEMRLSYGDAPEAFRRTAKPQLAKADGASVILVAAK